MPEISYTCLSPANTEKTIALIQNELRMERISVTDFYSKTILDPNFDPQSAIVAQSGDDVVGFMLGITRRFPLEDAPSDTDRAWITLAAVALEYQRKGIGSCMLERLTDVFKSKQTSSVWVSPYAPNYFTPGIDAIAYPSAFSFFSKHNFKTKYDAISMEADLSGIRMTDEIIARKKYHYETGTRIYKFEPKHIMPLTELLKDFFPGDWQRIMRESMLRALSGDINNQGIFVAMKDELCLGFCQYSGERFGPFGVRNDMRGQGLGIILLFECLRAMRDDRLNRAWFLWTGDRAARLYAQAGFTVVRRFAVMMKDIS